MAILQTQGKNIFYLRLSIVYCSLPIAKRQSLEITRRVAHYPQIFIKAIY